MKKIYCIRCGNKNDKRSERCNKCHCKLNQKESLWKDYIFDHIKDDLKGKVTDNIFSLLTNFIKSHLYGVVMSILVLIVGTGGIIYIKQDDYIEKVDHVPTSIVIEEKNMYTSVKTGIKNKYSFVYPDHDTCVKQGNEDYFTLFDQGIDVMLYDCEEVIDSNDHHYYGLFYYHCPDEKCVFYY